MAQAVSSFEAFAAGDVGRHYGTYLWGGKPDLLVVKSRAEQKDEVDRGPHKNIPIKWLNNNVFYEVPRDADGNTWYHIWDKYGILYTSIKTDVKRWAEPNVVVSPAQGPLTDAAKHFGTFRWKNENTLFKIYYDGTKDYVYKLDWDVQATAGDVRHLQYVNEHAFRESVANYAKNGYWFHLWDNDSGSYHSIQYFEQEVIVRSPKDYRISTWRLLEDVWIPAAAHGRAASQQKYSDHNTPVQPFNQMLLQARSTTTTINRILYWNTPQNDLQNVVQTKQSGELRLASDNVDSTTGVSPGGPWRFPEWHQFQPPIACRLIFRLGQIHCALDYPAVGGQDNNPRLGEWGRIWVRLIEPNTSTADLPASIESYPAL